MKKLQFFIVLGLVALFCGMARSIETATSLQEAQSTTGRTFLRMFRSPDSHATDKVLSLIGDIYAPRFNDGVIPDHETLYGLGQLLNAYLAAHPDKLDESMEKPVVEALKDAPAQIQAQKAFWERACKAAQAYFAQPSPENADRVLSSLPDRRLPGADFKGEVRLSGFFYDSLGADGAANLSNLIKRAESGDAQALDISFRLINISDGAFAEDLVYGLGTVIPKHPRLFLEKLQANQGKTEPPVLELLDGGLDPVGWWEIPENDPDHTKYREPRNARLDIRIKALKTVKDPLLKDLRDRCISIPEKMRNEIIG
jgi:hypothetical protein